MLRSTLNAEDSYSKNSQGSGVNSHRHLIRVSGSSKNKSRNSNNNYIYFTEQQAAVNHFQGDSIHSKE